MSDNRSVATDALATLGTIIDETAKRDAIHLAVIPMVAGNHLLPGIHVEVRDGKAYRTNDGQGVGIADPFLTRTIEAGQRFWLVIYPRTIQSLRHVWSHPAFPDEPVAGVIESDEVPPAILALRKIESEKWLRRFIENADCPGYERIMEMIGDGDHIDEYSFHVDGSASGEIPTELWDHVEIVIGRKVNARPAYFSCSC